MTTQQVPQKKMTTLKVLGDANRCVVETREDSSANMQLIISVGSGTTNRRNLKPAPLNEYTLETRDAPPAHLLTKINCFSMLSQHKIGIIESTEFKAGGNKWKVIIKDDVGDHISVKLCIVETDSLPPGWEVNAMFNFFIYNHISDKYHCFRGNARRFHATNSEWGFSKLIAKSSFKEPSNGFLIEDKCVFGAEVFVIANKPLVEKVSVLNLSQPYKRKWKFSNFSKQESSIVRPEELSAKGNKCCIDSKTLIHGKRVNALSFFSFGNKFNDKKHHSREEYIVEKRDASPAHLLTTIEFFSLLSKHKIKLFESAIFEAGDYKWKVKINLDEGAEISVYLCMVGTSSLPAGWEVNAIFNFILYNHISDKYYCFQGKARRFHAINLEWGFSKFITKKSLTDPSNGYLSDDKCVFGAEVFVLKNQPLIENVSVLRLSDPYMREWEISKFSKLEENWKSEEFSAGGYKWEITIHPEGSKQSCGPYASIFIQCVDANNFGDRKKVNAACRFFFRNKLHYKNTHSKLVRNWFTSTTPGWGFPEFIAISDMRDPCKGFVVDDCCIVEIQLSVLALQELHCGLSHQITS